MERLTERINGEAYVKRYGGLTSICYGCDRIAKCNEKKCGFYNAIEKLAVYEDAGLESEEIKNLVKTYNRDSTKCAQYEQLEEQGLLIKLPCKVGDTVYWISPFRSGINQGKIEFININKFGLDLAIMRQEGVLIRRGLETVFLTREEAEKALEA